MPSRNAEEYLLKGLKMLIYPRAQLDEIEKAVSQFSDSIKSSARSVFLKEGGRHVLVQLAINFGLNSDQFTLAATAMNFLGAKYVSGSKTPEKGTADCSGFVYGVCRAYMNLPMGRELNYFESTHIYNAATTRNLGTRIRRKDLHALNPGDIISRPDRFGKEGHVAIVLNNDPDSGKITIIDASASKGRVRLKTYKSYAEFCNSWMPSRSNSIGVIPVENIPILMDYFKKNYGGSRIAQAQTATTTI